MWDPEQVAAAKRHFGNPLRIQVAQWILENAVTVPFKLHEVQDGVRDHTRSVSSVPMVLASFVESRMLQRVSASGRVYYTLLEHELWTAYGSILHALRPSRPVRAAAEGIEQQDRYET